MLCRVWKHSSSVFVVERRAGFLAPNTTNNDMNSDTPTSDRPCVLFGVFFFGLWGVRARRAQGVLQATIQDFLIL